MSNKVRVQHSAYLRSRLASVSVVESGCGGGSRELDRDGRRRGDFEALRLPARPRLRDDLERFLLRERERLLRRHKKNLGSIGDQRHKP